MAGNYADPASLATSLAGRITKSAKDGKVSAEITLPPSYNQLSAPDRKAMAAAIGRIAKAVANELPEDTRGVRSVKISFGNHNEYIALSD